MIRTRMIGHGLAELRAHPWRAALSGLSLSIGVLAVVAIFTVAAITAEVFIATEEQRNGRLVTVSGTIEIGQMRADRLRSMLAATEPVTATGGGAVLIVEPAQLTGVALPPEPGLDLPFQALPVTLVAGDLDRVRRLPLLAGGWFDSDADLPVALMVNPAAARELGGVGTPLRLTVSAQYPPLAATISGVIADGRGDPALYVPLAALLHAQPHAIDGAPAQLLLHHPTAGTAALDQVGEQVATAGSGTLSSPMRRVDTVGLLLDQLRAQQAAFLAVAIVALAIAALGMLNIGLASVSERARELVIRRAVGATRLDILGQMLVSAMIVGIAAAALAVAVAWVGVQWWVPQRIATASAITPPGLPWTAIGWGVAAAATTTVAGALIPALVAARLDVATALRD